MQGYYRRQLALCEDKLEERSVRDHEDDKEGEGKGDLLERLHHPKESQAKGLKNGEENHPEKKVLSQKYLISPAGTVLMGSAISKREVAYRQVFTFCT